MKEITRLGRNLAIEWLFEIRAMMYNVTATMDKVMNMSNIAILLVCLASLAVVGTAFLKGKCA